MLLELSLRREVADRLARGPAADAAAVKEGKGKKREGSKGETQSARGLQKLPCHDTKGAQDKGDGGLANHPSGL